MASIRKRRRTACYPDPISSSALDGRRSVGQPRTPLGRPIAASAVGSADSEQSRPVIRWTCLMYHMISHGQEYLTQSMEEYEAQMKANILKTPRRKAAALGFQLSPLATE